MREILNNMVGFKNQEMRRLHAQMLNPEEVKWLMITKGNVAYNLFVKSFGAVLLKCIF
jgi:hypothetical protein